MQYQEQKLYTGNPRQLFSVRESRLLGGKKDGVRVADIHNGAPADRRSKSAAQADARTRPPRSDTRAEADWCTRHPAEYEQIVRPSMPPAFVPSLPAGCLTVPETVRQCCSLSCRAG